MLFRNFQKDFGHFLSEVGVAHYDQVLKLFRDQYGEKKVKRVLDMLIHEGLLRYYPEKKWVAIYPSAAEDKDRVEDRITALWVVSDIGSMMISDLTALKWPCRFLLLLEGGDAMDVSVCKSETEAKFAMKNINESKLIGEDGEDVSHLVIVPSVELGEKIADLGFDTFAVIDDDHDVIYYHYS